MHITTRLIAILDHDNGWGWTWGTWKKSGGTMSDVMFITTVINSSQMSQN